MGIEQYPDLPFCPSGDFCARAAGNTDKLRLQVVFHPGAEFYRIPFVGCYYKVNNRELRGIRFEYKRFIGEPFREAEGLGVEIKVLGPGCPRCEQIEQTLMTLIAEMKIEADLDHVRDPLEISKYGIMSMPALVINGEIKATGGVPPKEKLKIWLEQAASKIKT